MSHTYTPDPAIAPASITLPDDGDDFLATVWNNPIEDLADKLENTRQRGLALQPGYDVGFSAARTFTRINPGHGYLVEVADQANFEFVTFDVFAADESFARIDVPTGFKLVIPDVCVPDGATIVSVAASIDPLGADPGAGNRAKLSLVRVGGGVQTALLSLSEGTESGGTYTASHVVTRSVTPVVVDRSLYRYSLWVHGETGGSTVRVFDTRITFTATALRYA